MKRTAVIALFVSWLCVGVSASASLIPGDFNDDFVVDLKDFAVLQRQFNGLACLHGEFMADLDGSGCVELDDYLAMFDALRLGCGDPSDCGIQGPDDCFWKTIADARAAGQCNTLTDGVDRRMCALGILLDGDLSDAISAGAVLLVDTVADEAGNLPGPSGDQESPRHPGVPDPSGFNTARSVLLFVPDGDATDGIDDSLLYIAWDVSDHVNGDGLAPRQYDSDDDNSAADATDPGVSDVGLEVYEVRVQACTTDDLFPVDSPVAMAKLALQDPNSLFSNADERDAYLPMVNIETCAVPLYLAPEPPGLETVAFPTADNATNLTNLCIDQEIDNCAAGNNVELVIRRVETSGAFGPHDPAAPDSQEARENRFALAQTLAQLRGGTTGEISDEEVANVASRTLIPGLEVTKRLRCADSGQTEFTAGPVEALIGSTVEFELTITNVGNVDLEVTVSDVLEEIGSQAAFAACEVVCGFIEAELTSPRRGLVDFAVNVGNAATPPICANLGDPECLNGAFFIPSCDPGPDDSFLESVEVGTSAVLGTLLGAVVERDAGACAVTGGDTIVIRFLGRVGSADGQTDAFCAEFADGDCRNSVSVEGTLVGGGEVIAQDQAGEVDTDGERVAGGVDDNAVDIDVLCRDITFMKAVGFPGDQGSFVSGTDELDVPSVPPGGFIDIEYLYLVDNTGEVDEDVTITDPTVCDDISATQAAFPGGVQFTICSLCLQAPVGQLGPFTVGPADGTHAESCVVRFTSQDALRHFLTLDNGRAPCNEQDPGLSGDDCYRNCADASAVGANLGDICRPPVETITRSSFTTICNAQCELTVRKLVRCLPDCDPAQLDPGTGWVESPSMLDVTPGACLEYQVITENSAAVPIPICALNFNDIMAGAGNFQSGPTDVVMVGRTCTNVAFATVFNWDGSDVICVLDASLGAGETVTVHFQAQLKAAADIDLDAAPTNDVTVLGASEADCPDQGDPNFSCMDDASVAIDIRNCDFDLSKEVTCDDPRDAGAVFLDDLVDALPGSKVGFRIQVTNTGEVNLPRLDITEDLTCLSWFADSVVADVDGSDVTGCICPGGCNDFIDLSGLKDLTPCMAGGLAPGEILTITFEVKVPADFATTDTPEDCVNTVTVRAETDVCASAGDDPCPERANLARINVDVPEIDCDKAICVDMNNNGTCDDPDDFAFGNDIEVPGSAVGYPLTVVYKFTATNVGEADFADARVCDLALIGDLLGVPADIEIGPCALDGGSGCAALGALGNGDPGDAASTKTATCTIKFLAEDAWLDFAGRDNDGRMMCHSNASTAEGDVDAEGYCPREAELAAESDGCPARVCIEAPFIPTVSEWGLLILTLLLLVAYKVHFGTARRQLA